MSRTLDTGHFGYLVYGGLLKLVCIQGLTMTDVEISVIDGGVCPVRAATLGYAELAGYLKLGGIGSGQADGAAALIIEQKLTVNSDY